MYYIGFLDKQLEKPLIFQSDVVPSKSELIYFHRVIGPFGTEQLAKYELKLKRRQRMNNPSRAKYCRERQLSPSIFAKGSFRTIPLGGSGKKGVVACSKGHYHRGKCGVGTRLQTILHPEGSGRCPRGAGGREMAKRHDNAPPIEWKEIFDRLLREGYSAKEAMQLAWKEFRKTYDWYHGRVVVKNNPKKDNPERVISHKQALALTKKIIRYAEKLFKHERHGVKYGTNPGADYHDRKFIYYMKELEKYAIGSQPYIATLAKAYEHLESARESREGAYR